MFPNQEYHDLTEMRADFDKDMLNSRPIMWIKGFWCKHAPQESSWNDEQWKLLGDLIRDKV